MNTTTLSDILAHVQAEVAAAQAQLNTLYAERLALASNSPAERMSALKIQKATGQVLALATICGYLEARQQIDEINS